MIAKDKKLHLIAGFIVGAAAMFILADLGVADRGMRVLLSVVAAAAVGVGKEIYDKLHPDSHTVDPLDALYTGAGGIVGAVAATLAVQLAG